MAGNISVRSGSDQIMLKADFDGESRLPGFESQISCKAVGFDIELPTVTDRARGGVTTGKSVHRPVKVIKVTDKSSPKWLEHVCKGSKVGDVTFTYLRVSEGDPKEYLKIELGNVFCTHFYASGDVDENSDLPMEVVELGYETIKFTYTQQDESGAMTGSVDFGWNAATGQST